MINKKLKEKVVNGVTFQVWSITGTEIYIGPYFFKCKFNIENEDELKAIAIALKTFLEHLRANDYLAKVQDVKDNEKLEMMNTLINFFKEHIGE